MDRYRCCCCYRQLALPFLKLPGEIRNKIYELALQHDAKPIKLKRKVGFPVRSNPEQSQHAALTRVCQQIRHEYRPLQLQVQTVSSTKLCVSYNAFADDPSCKQFQDFKAPTRELVICFLKSSTVCDTSVNLLPILLRNAHPTVPFSCTVGKNHHLTQKMFNAFLLLSRLLKHDKEEWVALYKSNALDAVLLKLDGTHLEIRLKHNQVRDLDVNNERTVRNFLEQRSIVGVQSGSIVRGILGVQVTVTRCPAPKRSPK